MTGWKCPACGSAHAPDVKTCPNTLPVFPPSVPSIGDRCPRCGMYGLHSCITGIGTGWYA